MNFLSSLHNKDLGLLLVRVGLALVFMYHGWMKIKGMDAAIEFFGSIGLAPFFAYLVAWVEFLGGAALLLGVKVREVAVPLVIVMIVAIYKVHLGQGFSGMEFQIVLLLSTLGLVFSGSGKYALLKDKGCANCNSTTCDCQCKNGVCQCK